MTTSLPAHALIAQRAKGGGKKFMQNMSCSFARTRTRTHTRRCQSGTSVSSKCSIIRRSITAPRGTAGANYPRPYPTSTLASTHNRRDANIHLGANCQRPVFVESVRDGGSSPLFNRTRPWADRSLRPLACPRGGRGGEGWGAGAGLAVPRPPLKTADGGH